MTFSIRYTANLKITEKFAIVRAFVFRIKGVLLPRNTILLTWAKAIIYNTFFVGAAAVSQKSHFPSTVLSNYANINHEYSPEELT